MIDAICAAIQSADPTSLPLWAAVAFSLSLFPLGILLPCRGLCQCCCPNAESLPDEIILTLDNLSYSVQKTGPLLSLSISSCFGNGASGKVAGTGGTENEGYPISSVTLTNGGGGYAVLGRVEPSGLSLSSQTGSDAEFEIVLAADQDECSRPFWAIESVAVTKAGTNYIDGQTLSVSVPGNVVEDAAASLTLSTAAVEPTLELYSSPPSLGFGATAEIATTLVSANPNRWGAQTVSITTGGTGYVDGEQISFAVVGGGTTVTPGIGIVQTKHTEPQTVTKDNFGAGAGAIFSPMLVKFVDAGRDYWKVDDLIVNQGGSGYAINDFVVVAADEDSDGVTVQNSVWQVDGVSATGAILSLSLQNAGKMFADTGEIEAIAVTAAGSYYGTSSGAGSVTVNNGGRYFVESETQPAIVADVTCEIVQQLPSDGIGCEITATVDEDTQSETFGQITSLTLDNGGDGYLEFSYTPIECCVENLNGKTFLLTRDTISRCEYFRNCCGQLFHVQYKGAETPPEIFLGNGGNFNCVFRFEVDPESAPFVCEGINFYGTDIFGGTATVAEVPEDFDLAAQDCQPCCRGPTSLSCTSEDCIHAGGVWWQHCECDGCAPQNCPEDEYVVVLEMAMREDFALAGGGPTTAMHTLMLNAENGYSAESDLGYSYASASLPAAGPVNACAVAAYAQINANTLTGYVSAQTMGAGCINAGTVPLPAADGCPINGAVQLCGSPGGEVPANGFGPQQAASLKTTVTVIKP